MLSDFAIPRPSSIRAPDIPAQKAPRPGSRPWFALAVGSAVVLMVAVIAGVVLARYQNPSVHYDELFHVLGARHFLETGQPVLVPGGDPYHRGDFYTYMAARAYRWFGVSVESARLPALIAAALTVGAVGLLGFRAGGWLVAATTGGLLLLTPGFINAAGTARFYSAHVLGVVVLALVVYEACRPGLRAWARAAWFVAAALCGWMALHLHATTLVAGMGLGAWVALCALVAAMHGDHPRQRRLAWGLLIAGAVLLPVAAAIVLQTAWGQGVWETFRWSPGWSEGDRSDARYYHKLMLSLFGAMWPLFPLAAVAALATRWRPASLALCVFGVGFVVHSLGGAKAERYILYTYPFFWLTWGLALDALVRGLHAQVTAGVAAALPKRGFPTLARLGSAAVIAVCLAGFLHFQPFTAISRRMLTTPDRPHPYLGTAWAPAVPLLRDLAAESEAVVTTADLKALHYLGRLDLTLSRLGVLDAGMDEFDISPNTLKPVISTPESLAKAMDEAATGLIIVEPAYWRQPWAVADETADLIEARAARVKAPDGSNLLIFRWPRPQ